MKVSRLEEKKIRRADADESYTEKATMTDGSGDKITVTMGSVPKGLAEGAEVTVLILTNQTTIEEHS